MRKETIETSLTASTDRPQSSEKFRIGVTIALGLLAVGCLLLFIHTFTVGAFERKLQSLRDAGEPVEFADFQPKRIADDVNIAVALDEMEAESTALREALHERFHDCFRELLTATSWNEEEAADVAEILAEHEKTVDRLRQAIGRDDFSSMKESDHRPSTRLSHPTARFSVEVLKLQASLRLHDGDLAGSLVEHLELLTLARKLREDPETVWGMIADSSLLRSTLRAIDAILRELPCDDSVHERIQAECALLEDHRPLVLLLQRKRASDLDAYRSGMQSAILRDRLIAEPIMSRRVVAELEMYDWHLNAVSMPFHEFERSLPQPPNTLLLNHPVFNYDYWLNRTFRVGFERTRALSRCLRIVARTHQYGVDDREGIAPDALSLPKETFVDPFDGKSLRWWRDDDGWTVYSVGPNLLDDGGDSAEGADVGLGPSF